MTTILSSDPSRPLRVLVTGATGNLGHRVVRRLAANGHDVTGLSRHARGDAVVKDAGGTPVRGDLFDLDSLTRAARHRDVVLRLATAIPTGKTRPGPKDWALNTRIRREGTRNLLVAAAETGVKRYIQESITWVARQPDGRRFDESAPLHPDPLTQSAADAERIAREEGDRLGIATTTLRFGWFYAPDAPHVRDIAQGLKAGKIPIVGTGWTGRTVAVHSLIHVDDAAGGVVAAVERPIEGVYHVVDDQPATLAELFGGIARRIHAPPPRRAPAWLARWIIGADTARLLTHPAPTSNHRFHEATGWAPTYPDLEAGLDAVVHAWVREGFLGLAASAPPQSANPAP